MFENIYEFPALGKQILVSFTNVNTGDKLKFLLCFGKKRMSFRSVGNNDCQGNTSKDTVDYIATMINPGIWLVKWKENNKNHVVVHVEDFNTGRVWSTIVEGGENIISLEGKLFLVDDPCEVCEDDEHNDS